MPRFPAFALVYLLLTGMVLYAQTPAPDADTSTAPVNVADLQKRAEAGDPKAQLALGRAYGDGNGTTQNTTLAFNWVRSSAQQGYAPAQNQL